jgi:hypothetical protein
MCSPLLDGGSVEVLDKYARLFLEFLGRVNKEVATTRIEPAVQKVG